MHRPIRNRTGQAISNTIAPHSVRSSSGQIQSLWAGVTKLDTPVLGSATAVSGGFTFAISNYSALNSYTISTTAGSASQASGTVTESGLGYSASATVSVTATRSGYLDSDTATRTGTSSACVPAGCTPPCGGYTYSYSTTCATGQGGAQVPGSCGAPGCSAGCRYWNRDCYVYSQQSCTDNCGVVYYNTCASFCVDSTVAGTCC